MSSVSDKLCVPESDMKHLISLTNLKHISCLQTSSLKLKTKRHLGAAFCSSSWFWHYFQYFIWCNRVIRSFVPFQWTKTIFDVEGYVYKFPRGELIYLHGMTLYHRFNTLPVMTCMYVCMHVGRDIYYNLIYTMYILIMLHKFVIEGVRLWSCTLALFLIQNR